MDQIDDKEAERIINTDIIELLGLTRLSPEKQEEFRKQVVDTIQNRVMARVDEIIKAKGKAEEFARIENEEEIEKFLKDNGIDTEKLFLEESIYYKSQMVVAAKYADVGLKATIKQQAEESNA